MTSNKEWLSNVVDVELRQLPRDFAYYVPSELTETSSSEREFTFKFAQGVFEKGYAISVDAAGNVAHETREVEDLGSREHYEPGRRLNSRAIGNVANLGNEEIRRILLDLYAPVAERGRKELGKE